MKKSELHIFLLFLLLGCVSFSAKAQLPIWVDGAVGVGFPDGGKHFNTQYAHYPGFSFYLGAQTTWNHNWFELDSLLVGAEISTHHFHARNQGYATEENLHFNSIFLSLAKYFTYKNIQPFGNISLGISTMNSSGGSFVISMGGVIRAGAYLIKPKFSPGISIGYNAPWIAYHNSLTGFWELSVHLRLLSDLKFPQKQKNRASYENE